MMHRHHDQKWALQNKVYHIKKIMHCILKNTHYIIKYMHCNEICAMLDT